MRSAIFAAVAITALSAVGEAEALTISTLAQENSTIISWGLPDTAAYGQTFTLSSAATMNDVSFRINDRGTSVSFIAYLFEWAGNRTTGSALASVTGATSGTDAMETTSVDLGNVALGIGQYVAFLQATSSGSAAWGSVSADVYSGGAFVFQNNGGNEMSFGTSNWETNWQGSGSDLAFAMTFDNIVPIPLPAALPLMLLALGSLGLTARYKRKTA